MNYNSDFPISFLKQYHLSKSIPYQSDTFDMIYIISGTLTITSENGDSIEYPQNNVTVLHSNHAYRFEPSNDNIMIHFGINSGFMVQNNCIDAQILCDSILEPNRNYIQIKNLIMNISSQYLDNSDLHELSLLGQIYQLLALLQTDYSITVSDATNDGGKYQERISQIRTYLLENYRQQITLSSLADSMFLTPQYLSKFFKRHFHANFNQYLNQLRIEHTLRDIMYTSKSITDIAVQHGFPNISTFNRRFKEIYQISPREYRKKATSAPPVTAEWLSENREFETPLAVENINTREISAFVGLKTQMPHNFTKLINVGYAHNLLSQGFVQRLLKANQDLNLDYLRIEGMISNTMIPRLAGRNDYYFANVQTVLNLLYENGLTPFIELGKNSFDYLNYSMANVPMRIYSNKERFLNMFEAFLAFVTDHYDAEWLDRWHFELWKIPRESDDDYFEGFNKINRLIKKYLPNSKFGGPGHITSMNSDSLIHQLEEFRNRDLHPDFISVHFFTLQYTLDEVGNIDLSAVARGLRTQQLWILDRIKSIMGHEIPLYITEFNSSLIPQTYINESCFQATFITKNLLEMHTDSDMIGYWMLDDSSFKSKDLSIYLVNGISLINKNQIPTPAYHAYSFLNRMGEFLIEQGENYCITQSKDGNYQVLTYNYAHFANVESLVKNVKHSILDVYHYFESVPPITMKFTLSGLTPGKYRVHRHLLDRAHGSLLDVHLGGFRASIIDETEYMYKIQTPARADVDYLRKTCVPEERVIFLNVESELTLSITLNAHNVCFFDIAKEY
ncbi:GH39 family glycosyl hydrolase [Agathobacter ruminis]|uniref:HTH araC/xylS-type domain-containing protein n=1 Tax=Agathobacter ruminis TaxID=1712665 RepID=A0A2G3DZ43_9FIRM|nr:helix-turn-helix domain-containing protein [Agathobacter ruminis]MDC7302355.1 helix-turn-helix domain-containing protein [Agathobacter ruminis]PHU36231.1 hypothetical protein CSX02_13170 [Agathobacter ruminis]